MTLDRVVQKMVDDTVAVKHLSTYEGDLVAAVADIGTDYCTLIVNVVPVALLVAMDLSATNIHLHWENGCILTGAFTFTCPPTLSAGNYQIFDELVTVVLPPLNPKYNPKWHSTEDFAILQTPVTDSITAFAGGGQANAVELLTEVSRITEVATVGDSVKLTTPKPGYAQSVRNDGASDCDVFPHENGYINGALINIALVLSAGDSVTLRALDEDNWYTFK